MVRCWPGVDARTHWSLSRELALVSPGLDGRSEQDVVGLLRVATGIGDLDVEIERFSRFAFAAQIAERYRDGDRWLIGDAAHRMTPRGGTGMNTGIQDAFDLGWKIAWVLRDRAPVRLLDTYELERRPIALHNIGRAASAGGARRSTDEALLVDSTTASLTVGSTIAANASDARSDQRRSHPVHRDL